MKSFFDNIFGQPKSSTPQPGEAARKLQVATAALLLEIAHVDDEFTEEERSVIIKVMKGHFEITEREVEEILKATSEELDKRIDLYYFTNQINEHFDTDQKIAIIEMVWKIIYADRHLDGHEDSLVHRFAKLLRLQHSQLIDAKLRVKADK